MTAGDASEGRADGDTSRLSGPADHPGMSNALLGARVRAVRMHLGLRQVDVAAKAGVSAAIVGRVEHDEIDRLPIRSLRAVLRAVEMDLHLMARWHGGELDRLMDEGHALLVGLMATRLEAAGWVVNPEVSFAVYGERGSIDLLAWHPASRTLLVIEVKTSLNSLEETLRRQDMKVRHAARVARERFGWQARATASMLVLPDDDVARRRVERLGAVLRRAFPVRGDQARAWLREPSGAPGMLLFVGSEVGSRRVRIAPRRRVRRARGAGSRASTGRVGVGPLVSPPGGA